MTINILPGFVFLALTCIATPLTINAQTDNFKNRLVKVQSFPCASKEKPLLNGTGFIVRTVDDGHWVLTSEHVLSLGRDPDYCYSVHHHELNDLPATLIRYSWLLGAALLKIPLQTNLTVSDLTAADIATPTQNDTLRVLGYRWWLKEFFLDNQGRVLHTESPSHEIPGLKTAIETIDAHGEFGMSGGPVCITEKWVGMLSHQYLEMVPGKPVVVKEFKEEDVKGDVNDERRDTVKNHLLVIPAQPLLKWIDDVSDELDFQIEPGDRLKKQQIIYADGLALELVGYDGQQFVLINPIGGQEGVGGRFALDEAIKSDQNTKLSGVYIRVRKDRLGHWHSGKMDRELFARHFHPRLEKIVQKGDDGLVFAGLQVEQEGHLQVTMARSLAHFIQLLSTMPEGQLSEVGAFGDAQKQRHITLKALLDNIIQDTKLTQLAPERLDFLKRVVRLTNGPEYVLIGKQKLEVFLDTNSGKNPFWKTLFEIRFDDAIALYSTLNELKKDL